MRKCKDRLAEFYYSGKRCPMIWPGAQVIPLSNLKSLSLSSGYIEARNSAHNSGLSERQAQLRGQVVEAKQ